MRQIVEFMLTRMDTHPEEFLQEKKQGVKHNWMGYYKNIKKFLTEEENQAIWSKLSDINLEDTMGHITQKLLEPENEEVHEAFDAYKYGQRIVASHEQMEAIKLAQKRQMEQMRQAISTSVFELERKVPFKMEGRYESDKDNG
jgi:hypothetical protein